MPKIADTNFIMNRREMYLDNPDQEAQGNRVTVIPPEIKEQLLQTDQYFPDKSIDGGKIGPIVDTGGAGITSTGETNSDVRFWAGSTFANRATAPFRVTKDGHLYATTATIPAPSSIAGFTIGTDYIVDAADSFGLASTVTGGDDVRFWAGTTFASRNSAPFRVTESGAVTASTITATGTINATAGYIGSTTALVYESTGINTGVTGHIRGGQSAYDTGTGYFLGYTPASAVYQFSIGQGSASNNALLWDGINLYVNGRLFSTDPVFGDGSDGDVVINESAALARDMFYNKLTIAQASVDALTFNPTVDGVARRTIASDTWADIRTGAGTSADSVSQTMTVNLVGSAAGSTWEILRRAIMVFDTSSIPDNATITSATLQLYATSKNDVASQSISIATRTDPGSIGASDFDIANWTMTRQATDITISAITTGAFNTFTLNAAGLASISKTGNTMFGIILSGDIDNSEPTWSSNVQPEVVFNSTDSVNKPILTVTYSLASTFNTPTGTSGDGYARRVSANSVFSTLRTSAGTASNSSDTNITVQLDTGTTTDRFDRIDRGILTFDTSTLPDNATILSATLSLYVNSKTDNMSQSIAIGTRTNPGVIDNADYNIANWTMTAQATAKTIASLTTSAYNIWTLNAAGLATITLTGTTVFGVLLSADIDDTAPTWSSNVQADINFDSADGTNKPVLTVLYKVASPVLNPSGYRIFAKKYVAVTNGSIARNGGNGGDGGNGVAGTTGDGAAGGTGGAAGAAGATLASGSIYGAVAPVAGIIGGAGGVSGAGGGAGAASPAASAGITGAAATSSIGSTGATGKAGVQGGAGGAGNGGAPAGGAAGALGALGAAGTATTAASSPRNVTNLSTLFDTAAATLYKGSSGGGGAGGSSGGGGGADKGGGTVSGSGGGAGGSGGAGSNGGMVFIASPTITVGTGGSIASNGGNGGAGGNGGNGGNADLTSGGGGGGASGSGGAGGDGGIIALIYTTYSNSGSVTVTAGTGGAAGTAGTGGTTGTGVAGSNGGTGTTGNSGTVGKIIQLSLN